jgi:hypothetical protein
MGGLLMKKKKERLLMGTRMMQVERTTIMEVKWS